MHSLGRKILLNGLSTYVRGGGNVLLGLLLTRFALDELAEYDGDPIALFGVFSLLLTVASSSNFLNDGLQKATIRFLSLSQSESDLRGIFSSSWVLTSLIGLSVASGLGLISPQLVALLDIPPEFELQAVTGLRAIAFFHALTALLQPWRAAMLSRDQYAVENFRAMAEKVLSISVLLAAPLHALPPIVALAVVWQSSQPITLLPVALLGIRKQGLRPSFGSVSWQQVRSLFGLSGWSSLVGLASNLYERTDQILINVLLGPTYNAIYAIATQFQGYVTALAAALSNVLLPTASRIGANSRPDAKAEFIVRCTRYLLVISLPMAVIAAIFADELIRMWVGPGFAAAASLAPWMMALMVCRMPAHISWVYLTAVNRLRWPALALLVDAIVNVILSIYYVSILGMGIQGVVIGTLSTFVLRLVVFQIPYLARWSSLSAITYWKRAVWLPLQSLILLLPVVSLLAWGTESAAFRLGGIAICLGAYGIWVWKRVFDPFEHRIVLGLVGWVPDQPANQGPA